MSFLRPEAKAVLSRWAEPLLGAIIAIFGFYLSLQGGWLLAVIGLALVALGLGWLVLGIRRARFQGDPAAPGLVEIDEGGLRYLHPRLGGEISLNDLAELRLVFYRGKRVWRLQDLSGQVLLVPMDAAGAGDLFDALSALPGMGSAVLVEALSSGAEDTAAAAGNIVPIAALRDKLVWSRGGKGLRKV